MKTLLGVILGLLLLAFLPAWADTASDLAQCQKTVKFKTGDIVDDDVAVCMQGAGYLLDGTLQMDSLTQCHNMLYPAIELRCYRKPGTADTSKVPAPLPPDWREAKIDALLAQEVEWTEKCRDGMSSKYLTQDVCNRRDRLVMVLQARGLCHQADDPKDLVAAHMKWQPCRKDAN